jgi:hypothetical protein
MAGDEAKLWNMTGAKGISLLTGHDAGDYSLALDEGLFQICKRRECNF